MRWLVFVVVLLQVSNYAYARQLRTVVADVAHVGTAWEHAFTESACIYLSTNDVVLIDLSKEKGKAEFAIALSAQTAGKPVRVIFDDSLPLVGGCNTGTTIRPHGIVTILNN